MTKSELRKKFIKLREEQPSFKKYKKDKKILQRLARFKPFSLAKDFFTYINHQGEVATDILIKKYFGKKRIVVPKVDGKKICLYELHNPHEFKNGKFGIREPKFCMLKKDFKKIDVALIPGVAFDKTGHRIGFGSGYFDRFLKKIHCTTIGLAYELQIVEKVPVDKYDVAVDYIVTEKRIIKCRGASQ